MSLLVISRSSGDLMHSSSGRAPPCPLVPRAPLPAPSPRACPLRTLLTLPSLLPLSPSPPLPSRLPSTLPRSRPSRCAVPDPAARVSVGATEWKCCAPSTASATSARSRRRRSSRDPRWPASSSSSGGRVPGARRSAAVAAVQAQGCSGRRRPTSTPASRGSGAGCIRFQSGIHRWSSARWRKATQLAVHFRPGSSATSTSAHAIAALALDEGDDVSVRPIG